MIVAIYTGRIYRALSPVATITGVILRHGNQSQDPARAEHECVCVSVTGRRPGVIHRKREERGSYIPTTRRLSKVLHTHYTALYTHYIHRIHTCT